MKFDKSKKILVIGRAGMDIYPEPPGTKITDVKDFSTHLGGSAANTCVALSKLGVKVIIVAFAEELTLALNAKGISGHINRFCIRGYKNSKAIVSVSNFARNVLIEKLNVKSDIIVIPTPVHNSKFSYINIEEKKNLKYLKYFLLED